MIIKNKYNKIILTKNDYTITFKKFFIKRTINISDIKSIYLTNTNHLNILTYFNKYIEKHLYFPNESTKQLLKELIKSVDSENIIVGTDFFKHNIVFVIFYWAILLNSLYPDKYKFLILSSTLLLCFIIYLFAILTQCYYLYNIDSCTVSAQKRNKIISVFNFKDCIYKKLSNYNTYKEYRYKKHRIFFPNTVSFPIEYNYTLTKNK